MGRVLFWVILIAAIAIAWAVSRRRNSLSNKEREELARLRGELRARKEDRRSGEAMRRCPVCGTYFPEKTGDSPRVTGDPPPAPSAGFR